MKKKKREKLIPDWIIRNLRVYGNCACGYDIVKKIGKEKLINHIKAFGYDCSLRIIDDPNDDRYIKRKMKYPPSAYYILDVDKVLIAKNE